MIALKSLKLEQKSSSSYGIKKLHARQKKIKGALHFQNNNFTNTTNT